MRFLVIRCATCLMVGLLATAAIALWASTGSMAEMQAGRSVEIAGETVRITANVADDVFAAGREVTLDGARVHSLIAGAGRLVLRNGTVRDLIAGGLDVEIHGQIEDDAVVAVCPVCPGGGGRGASWSAVRRASVTRPASSPRRSRSKEPSAVRCRPRPAAS